MATTARIVATTAANTSYAFSIASGVRATFGCSGLSGIERIVFEKKKAGGTYDPITYIDNSGSKKTAELMIGHETISITGPVDARINKPVTANSVEVVEYT